MWDHAGLDNARQDHRRRVAGGRVWRTRGHHGDDRAAWARLPGRDSLWKSSRHGRWTGHGLLSLRAPGAVLRTVGASVHTSGWSAATGTRGRPEFVGEPGGIDVYLVLPVRPGHRLGHRRKLRHRSVRSISSRNARARDLSPAVAV